MTIEQLKNWLRECIAEKCTLEINSGEMAELLEELNQSKYLGQIEQKGLDDLFDMFKSTIPALNP